MVPLEETSFDHNSLEWLSERHRHNDELRAQCPVVRNQSYGGYWFVSGHDAVAAVARDDDTFSSRYDAEPIDGLEYLGIMGIPRGEGVPVIGIAEADRPTHAALRRAINPYVLPPAVQRDTPFLQEAASWFLDQKIEDGRMEMVRDFTGALPALWTMRLLDLDPNGWEHYAEVFHAMAAYGKLSRQYQKALSLVPVLVGELTEIIEARRRSPGQDLLSRLVTLEVDGERLGDDELIGVLWNLIGGGLDTTTSLTTLALHHLAQHPQLRNRLIERPELVPVACEEYLRWTSVNETLTRTCTRDTELSGQRLQRGDYVMVSWLGANFDPSVFDHPDQVSFDRGTNPHLAFGVGAHRCIGLHVARSLFLIMVEEVLRRIPDYRVDVEGTRFYQGNVELHGVVEMPVSFAPQARSSARRPY